jgi:hypothetical protein
VLPSLSSATAITQLQRTNSTTDAYNGTYTIVAAGDYSQSTNQYLYIFGGSGGDVIKGATANNAVSQIYGSTGNDTITGGGYYTIMNGGAGTNTLRAIAGTNQFRMSTADRGTDTISAAAGTTNSLQIYNLQDTATSVSLGNNTLWNFLQSGNDLTGFVKDSKGNISTFTVAGQYGGASSAVQTFDMYLQGTTGSYLGAGLGSPSSSGHQIFAGTNGNDVLNLNSVTGLTRAWIFGNSGNDTITTKDGVVLRVYETQGGGVDTVVYSHARAGYAITSSINTTGALSANVTYTGVTTADYLSNVQRLKFTDTMLALDTGKDQTAGSGYMLYKAAFNRTPDVGGLGFWISKMDGGMSYDTVAQNFVNSQEFKTAFGGSNPTVNTLVTKLYNNVLNRTPDAGGLAFWQDKLSNGGWTVANVLGYFATSAENVTNVTPLIASGIQYDQFVG